MLSLHLQLVLGNAVFFFLGQAQIKGNLRSVLLKTMLILAWVSAWTLHEFPEFAALH